MRRAAAANELLLLPAAGGEGAGSFGARRRGFGPGVGFGYGVVGCVVGGGAAGGAADAPLPAPETPGSAQGGMCGMARLLELTGGFVSPRILSAISRPEISEVISELRGPAPEANGVVNGPPSTSPGPRVSHGSPLREVSPTRAHAGGGALSARASPVPLQNLENLENACRASPAPPKRNSAGSQNLTRAGAWLRPLVSTRSVSREGPGEVHGKRNVL